jgi:hypothetical protein
MSDPRTLRAAFIVLPATRSTADQGLKSMKSGSLPGSATTDAVSAVQEELTIA